MTSHKRCGSYKAGHEPHYIQVRKSNEPGTESSISVRIVEVTDDGGTVVELDGERLELWNHDPTRLRAIVASAPNSVTLQPRWNLLRVGSTVFSMADADDQSACPVDR
jgi:hypothetical protein